MNKKQFERLLPIAYKVATNGVHTYQYEDKETGRAIAWAFSIGDTRFDGVEDFYAAYPQCHSPYKVRPSQSEFTLVFVTNEDTGCERPVDGEPHFTKRQAAYRRCKELNRWWQKRPQ